MACQIPRQVQHTQLSVMTALHFTLQLGHIATWSEILCIGLGRSHMMNLSLSYPFASVPWPGLSQGDYLTSVSNAEQATY
jgi:hypothetical protein